MIIITKAMESKSKKQFQYRVRIDFSLQQSPTVSSFHNLVEKGAMTLLTAMSGGSFVPSVQICLYLFFLEKYTFYTYRFGNTELQIWESAFEVQEFSTFICM